MAGLNGKIVGGFRVIEQIHDGETAQGIVCKAKCEVERPDVAVARGQVVALKVMPARDDAQRQQWRRLEARTKELAQIDHENVVKYYGCFCEQGEWNELHVIVQEFLEGETLKERLERFTAGLDVDEAIEIAGGALAGLEHVASKGIVHRDIKPGNIFICEPKRRGGRRTVKLIDFEIARQSHGSTTASTGNLRGSFNYMAPEFFLDPNFRGDMLSDVFSMGVTLHEMLTGKLPYRQIDDNGKDAILDFVARWKGLMDGANPVAVNTGVRRLLAHTEGLFAGCLAPVRENRCKTFAEFSELLKRVRFRTLANPTGEHVYQMLQYIGKGGFGEVFKARQQKSGLVVAIKHLRKAGYADRFRREAKILSRLDDGCFVRFVESFSREFDGKSQEFLVMEFLDGMPGNSLLDAIKRSGGAGLPPADVFTAFMRYARGLKKLHSFGVYHRDIKPSNLYFPQGRPELATIMDLGIARDSNGTLTVGSVPGTPDYMPPEVVSEGSRGDGGMDVYALGLCLYEALSAKQAFPRLPAGIDGFRKLLERVNRKEKPNFDFSKVDSDVGGLLLEMTAFNPADRIRDAGEVERRLQELLPDSAPAETMTSVIPQAALEALGGASRWLAVPRIALVGGAAAVAVAGLALSFPMLRRFNADSRLQKVLAAYKNQAANAGELESDWIVDFNPQSYSWIRRLPEDEYAARTNMIASAKAQGKSEMTKEECIRRIATCMPGIAGLDRAAYAGLSALPFPEDADAEMRKRLEALGNAVAQALAADLSRKDVKTRQMRLKRGRDVLASAWTKHLLSDEQLKKIGKEFNLAERICVGRVYNGCGDAIEVGDVSIAPGESKVVSVEDGIPERVMVNRPGFAPFALPPDFEGKLLTVGEGNFTAEKKRKADEAAARAKAEAEAKRRAKEARVAAEKKRRAEEEAAAKAEVEAKRKAEAERVERERVAAEKKRREAEAAARAKAEAEAKRKAEEEAAAKAEAERVERERVAAEKKRLEAEAAARAKAEAEAKRKAEEEAAAKAEAERVERERIAAEKKRREAEAAARAKAEAEAKRKAEEEAAAKAEAECVERERVAAKKKRREAEAAARAKAEAEAKRRAEEEAAAKAEAERVERERIAAEKKRREAEAEAKRKAEEEAAARRKAAEEAAAKAEAERIERERVAAEKKRREAEAAARAKAEAEAKRRAEEEAAARAKARGDLLARLEKFLEVEPLESRRSRLVDAGRTLLGREAGDLLGVDEIAAWRKKVGDGMRKVVGRIRNKCAGDVVVGSARIVPGETAIVEYPSSQNGIAVQLGGYYDKVVGRELDGAVVELSPDQFMAKEVAVTVPVLPKGTFCRIDGEVQEAGTVELPVGEHVCTYEQADRVAQTNRFSVLVGRPMSLPLPKRWRPTDSLVRLGDALDAMRKGDWRRAEKLVEGMELEARANAARLDGIRKAVADERRKERERLEKEAERKAAAERRAKAGRELLERLEGLVRREPLETRRARLFEANKALSESAAAELLGDAEVATWRKKVEVGLGKVVGRIRNACEGDVVVDGERIAPGGVAVVEYPESQSGVAVRMAGYRDKVVGRELDGAVVELTPGQFIPEDVTVAVRDVGDGVSCWFNGAEVSESFKVRPGRHAVTFRREGYEAQTLEFDAKVMRGCAVAAPEKWTALPVEVSLPKLAPGVSCWLGGSRMDSSVRLRPGRYDFKYRRDDYETQAFSALVEVGRATTLPVPGLWVETADVKNLRRAEKMVEAGKWKDAKELLDSVRLASSENAARAESLKAKIGKSDALSENLDLAEMAYLSGDWHECIRRYHLAIGDGYVPDDETRERLDSAYQENHSELTKMLQKARHDISVGRTPMRRVDDLEAALREVNQWYREATAR